jgi:hypothetical protein
LTAAGAQLSTIHAIVIDVDADRATQKLPHATVAAPAELLAASALFVGCFDMVYHHQLPPGPCAGCFHHISPKRAKNINPSLRRSLCRALV